MLRDITTSYLLTDEEVSKQIEIYRRARPTIGNLMVLLDWLKEAEERKISKSRI